MSYPKAEGLPELRAAIAGWIARRFGVTLDPDRELIPTLGSKEAIFSFAQVFVDVAARQGHRARPRPGLPRVRARRRVRRRHDRAPPAPRRERLSARSRRPSTASCSTGRPSCGSTTPTTRRPRSRHGRSTQELAELAARHDFLVCSDEAYSELWFDEPPASALELADRSHAVVFNTLSKRSSMTGYRSGVRRRPRMGDRRTAEVPADGWHSSTGVRPACLDRRVERRRPRRTRARRLPAQARRAAARRSRASAGGRRARTRRCTSGSHFLTARRPRRRRERLLEHGIVVAPGAYLGETGEGYARVALVPTVEDCERAAGDP